MCHIYLYLRFNLSPELFYIRKSENTHNKHKQFWAWTCVLIRLIMRRGVVDASEGCLRLKLVSMPKKDFAHNNAKMSKWVGSKPSSFFCGTYSNCWVDHWSTECGSASSVKTNFPSKVIFFSQTLPALKVSTSFFANPPFWKKLSIADKFCSAAKLYLENQVSLKGWLRPCSSGKALCLLTGLKNGNSLNVFKLAWMWKSGLWS